MSERAHDDLPDLIFSPRKKAGKVAFAPSSIFGIYPIQNDSIQSFKVGITYSRQGIFLNEEVQESITVAQNETQTIADVPIDGTPAEEISLLVHPFSKDTIDEENSGSSIPHSEATAPILLEETQSEVEDDGVRETLEEEVKLVTEKAEALLNATREQLKSEGHRSAENKKSWTNYISVDVEGKLDRIKAKVAPPKLSMEDVAGSSFEGFTGISPGMNQRSSYEMRETVKEAKATVNELRHIVEEERVAADQLRRDLIRFGGDPMVIYSPSNKADISRILYEFERRIAQDRDALLRNVREAAAACRPAPLSPLHSEFCRCGSPSSFRSPSPKEEDWKTRLQEEQDRQWSLLMRAGRTTN